MQAKRLAAAAGCPHTHTPAAGRWHMHMRLRASTGAINTSLSAAPIGRRRASSSANATQRRSDAARQSINLAMRRRTP